MKKKVSIQVGPSFTTLLLVLFIALKLTGAIDWSWWWVLAPFWIPFLIALSMMMLAFILKIVVDIL